MDCICTRKRETTVERMTMILMKNALRLPGLWLTLCRHARHPEKYPEEVRYGHIRHAFSAGSENREH